MDVRATERRGRNRMKKIHSTALSWKCWQVYLGFAACQSSLTMPCLKAKALLVNKGTHRPFKSRFPSAGGTTAGVCVPTRTSTDWPHCKARFVGSPFVVASIGGTTLRGAALGAGRAGRFARAWLPHGRQAGPWAVSQVLGG